MYKEAGVKRWYSGLPAALTRQTLYGGIRLTLYDNYLKSYFHNLFQGGQGPLSLGTKVVSAFSAGSIAMCIAQPTDVIRVQMQSDRGRYPNMRSAFGSIWSAKGIPGLWVGLAPNVSRNAVTCAVQLASYDQAKEAFVDYTSIRGIPLHLVSAVTAAFTTVTVNSPIDVVKTRVMNDAPDAQGRR